MAPYLAARLASYLRARAQALSAMRKLYGSRRNTERPGAATIWVVWCSQVLLPPNPWTIVVGDIRGSSRHLPTITISGSAQPSPPCGDQQ